ncbi:MULTISPECIES: methyltransferase domain-containing protein [unclassified Streptomyces]|uniref:methyltransferase domain-containing protein n=1 Tax=unclassified Streptomyces TaxID=2593676 RepID=UPI0033B273C5
MSTPHSPGSQTPSAEALIALLDVVDKRPEAGRLRSRSYALLGIRQGVRVVDVGCGTGRAVGEMAQQGALAVGVDVDEHMVGVAEHRWPGGTFHQADATRLPFGDGAFDGYRADKVFHSVSEPAGALAEAHRVLAPGGRITLIGQDWDTLVIDADDPELARTIVHARADLLPSPRVARGCRNLLLDAGFEDATVEVHTGVFTEPIALPIITGLADAAHAAGSIPRAEADAWIADQTRRARSDRLFLAIPLFLVTARRP